jgi:hypothetical protein
MKSKVTLEMVLDLDKKDTPALQNATPAELLQTAQLQHAEVKVEISKVK